MGELEDWLVNRMASSIWWYPSNLRTLTLHDLLDKFGLLGFTI